MKRRAIVLAASVALALTFGVASRVLAECNRGDYGYDGYREGGYGRVSYDSCGPVLDRIDHDRGLIEQWEGTGRHQKVVRWAHEDLAKAERDLYQCRTGRRPGDGGYASYDPSYPPRDTYDPNDPRESSNDPYYGSDEGFDWKRDWPLVLGTVLNGQLGR